ncbi:hypothetical protein BJ508DRAFT_90280 [Ascobolus immersus RN42]|uniref:Uncharacterized protein n=1 Tax=Ascobolus immersus RN42 TaxID=1160509 RepID=A0A3N4IDQ3_ASCIM|nr:hypothetical protein BJ508DRAFT_90280 [Ascobolus immersus RN42]
MGSWWTFPILRTIMVITRKFFFFFFNSVKKMGILKYVFSLSFSVRTVKCSKHKPLPPNAAGATTSPSSSILTSYIVRTTHNPNKYHRMLQLLSLKIEKHDSDYYQEMKQPMTKLGATMTFNEIECQRRRVEILYNRSRPISGEPLGV